MNIKRFTDHYKQILLTLILIAIAARTAAAFYLGTLPMVLPGVFDQISYHALATRVLEGHGFSFETPWWPITMANEPTAHWSYLYTFFLTLVYSVFGPNPLAARLLQAFVVGVAHPVVVYLISTRLFGRLVGLASAAATALYAYFIYYTATLMTEPFYITMILASLYLAMLLAENPDGGKQNQGRSRRDIVLGLGLGLSLGATVLFRQLFLLFLPFIFLWIWHSRRSNASGRSARPLILASLVLAAMILPFTYYNYVRFDRFVLLNTNAGYAFFWGNHPIYGTEFIPILPREMPSYQELIPQELRHLDEAALDQALLKLGIQFVLDDPVRYVLLSIDRIPEYFRFWPTAYSRGISNLARAGSFGIFWPFMLYGLFRAVRNHFADKESTRRTANVRHFLLYAATPEFLLILFALVYTGIHVLSWTLIRYRLPVDAVMIIFAAFGIVDLAGRFSSWRKSSRLDRRANSVETSVGQ